LPDRPDPGGSVQHKRDGSLVLAKLPDECCVAPARCRRYWLG